MEFFKNILSIFFNFNFFYNIIILRFAFFFFQNNVISTFLIVFCVLLLFNCCLKVKVT
jgi:hypothetical protein